MPRSMELATVFEARRVFGADMLGVEEVSAALGFDVLASLSAAERERIDRLSFDTQTLMRAADDGMMLVLRVARNQTAAPLTILELAGALPRATELATAYRGSWFAAEPFATSEACRPGWALVDKQPFAASRNRPYGEQNTALHERARATGLSLRRRSAIEVVYDTLLYAEVRRERLLESEWDWSSSTTSDGGLVTVGEFDDQGLRLQGYSKAVRFATLGVCATLESQE
ncbi:MAG: hypothetical protein ACREQ9_23935 [Candidatus Binatia bacterium]